MWRLGLVGCVLWSVGCLRTTQYKCTSDAQCGTGRCEEVGFCSFHDPGCGGSMQRFGEYAGELSQTCVGASGELDAGTDTTTIDAPVSNCPGDFMTITNGTVGHRYKRVTATDPWNMQRSQCSGMGTAYLAVPDDAAELQAVVDLNGGNKIWLGISDSAAEGSWVTVKGAVQAFLPWKSGAPTLTPPTNSDDCVVADSETEIIDETCNQQYAAVCECDP